MKCSQSPCTFFHPHQLFLISLLIHIGFRAHDNVKFASSGGDRSVFVWDVATAQTTRRLTGHMGKINAVEFNDDASVVASGTLFRHFMVLKSSTDSRKARLTPLYDYGIYGMSSLAIGAWPKPQDASIRSQSRQPIQTLDNARDAIQSLHVGNTYILTGSVDGHIRTYDLRKGELRADYLGHPVTSVVPTQDGSTALVSTLDSHVRLMDLQTGAMLNDFKSHRAAEYRVRACFGHGEATVICGDENGQIWAWDLVDVRNPVVMLACDMLILSIQAKPLQPSPPPKVHDKVILWVEHHPIDPGEMISASADGIVKVWKS